MTFLKTFTLAVCVQAMAVVIAGSTVVQDEAVLLYENNYNQGVGLGNTDAPSFRHFYDVVAKSPRRSKTGRDVLVAPFETPPLSDGFSGSFVFDTAAPDRSEFASRITDFVEQFDAEGLRLYVGLSAAPNIPVVSAFGSPETILGIHDSRLPGSTLEFVRFDINKWQVSGGVVSYDINISYWGQPAASPDKVATVDI
jgi:hypothetical protein